MVPGYDYCRDFVFINRCVGYVLVRAIYYRLVTRYDGFRRVGAVERFYRCLKSYALV